MKITRPMVLIAAIGLVLILAMSILTITLWRQRDRIIDLAQNIPTDIPGRPGNLSSWGWSAPQTVTDSVAPGETKEHEFEIEKAGGMIFECVSAEYLQLALIDPQGERIDSAAIGIDSLRGYANVPIEENKVVTDIFLGDNPPPGKWIVEIINPNRQGPRVDYSVSAVIDRPEVNLELYTDREKYQRNDTITIIARFSKGSSPLLEARVTAYVSHRPDITDPSQSADVDTLQLHDDGTHGDAQSGDGNYSNIVANTAQGGDFSIAVLAEAGGEPPITRWAVTGTIIPKNRAHFTGKFTDFGRDTDGDGLYDGLVITAGIDVIDANQYEIKGELRYSTPSGGKPAKGKEYAESLIDNASVDTFLSAGSHDVFLPFEGKLISEKYRDGPYVLDHIVAVAQDTLDGEVVDYLDDAYTTGKYKVRDFEGEAIIVIGNPTDRGLDIDGDGLFDSLIFTVDIDLKESDYYHWQGDLFGSLREGVHLHYDGYWEAGRRTLVLAFPGNKIRRSAGDGPYEIMAPPMYGDRWKSVPRGEAGTLGGQFRTKAYRAEQFEE